MHEHRDGPSYFQKEDHAGRRPVIENARELTDETASGVTECDTKVRVPSLEHTPQTRSANESISEGKEE